MIVKPVETKDDLKEFIRLPWKIYQNDASWCPPFISDCKSLFTGKHPFYEYGNMKLFIAQKNGETVGRIAAIKNDRHNEQYQEKAAFWGFFECIDEQKVADQLFDTAKQWAKQQGFTKIIGPASPSSTYDYGCQYSGFEHKQVLLSTHNAPYYFKLHEGYGFKKNKDLYAYNFAQEKVAQLFDANKIARSKRGNIQIVEWNPKDPKGELLKIKKIFNKSWEKNPGYIPLTDAEFQLLYDGLKFILDKTLITFAELEGEVVGCMIVVPDYNPIFQQMNGRLFPFNFLKIFTKKHEIDRIRIFIAGVLPEYRCRFAFSALYADLIQKFLQRGLKSAEASYILECNQPIIKPIEKIGGEIYKKYRVFELEIA